MPTDKAAYLAAHYLTADSKPSKKKRKVKHNDGGLLIKDDDDDGWVGASRADDNGEDPDAPVLVAGTSAEFRRSKKSSWKRVGAPIPTDAKDARDAEAAAADAVLASAAAELAAAQAAGDEVPVVAGGGSLADVDMEDDDDDDPDGPEMMADGAHAGLQSAAAITAQLERRQRKERKALERLNKERAAGKGGEGEQLVLRDATGRRVDPALRRAEMRKAAAEAEQKERQDEEARKRALRGEVQLEEARKRREALEDAALMPLARTRDDKELNEELMAAERWNDPMAQFMGDDSGGARGKTKKSRRPLYKGPSQPNRYGIRPGYRWDGVDRGNGFEAERFKALNRIKMNKNLEYSWQMDE